MTSFCLEHFIVFQFTMHGTTVKGNMRGRKRTTAGNLLQQQVICYKVKAVSKDKLINMLL